LVDDPPRRMTMAPPATCCGLACRPCRSTRLVANSSICRRWQGERLFTRIPGRHPRFRSISGTATTAQEPYDKMLECEINDPDGKLIAKAMSTCTVLRGDHAKVR